LSALEDTINKPREAEYPEEIIEEVAALFHEYLPWMQVYTDFIINYRNVSDIVERWEKQNKNSRFLKFWSNNSRHGEATLDSFLVLPVQRLPRYGLFLERLVSYSSPPDRLAAASKAMSSLLSEINDRRRQCEDTIFVNEIRNSLKLGRLYERTKPWLKVGKLRVIVCRRQRSKQCSKLRSRGEIQEIQDPLRR
jgi:hypothetical protein